MNYAPGDSFAHRLDPRSKLAFQAAFALAAFVHTTPRGLATLTPVVAVVLVASRTPPAATLRSYRAFLPFLLAAPVLEGLTWGPPWFAVREAVGPTLAAYRVVLVLLVSTAYVRTTPARESRAAIQRLVPGRTGVLLGASVGFVLRLLPLLRDDLSRIRAAIDARLGSERSLRERIRLVGQTGLRRVFRRSDRFALALQARCFSWNPTLPELRLGARDVPVVAAAVALVVVAVGVP